MPETTTPTGAAATAAPVTPSTPAVPARSAVPASPAKRPDRESVRTNFIADLVAEGVLGSDTDEPVEVTDPLATADEAAEAAEDTEPKVDLEGPAWDDTVNRFRGPDGQFVNAPADATPEQKVLEAKAKEAEAPKAKPLTEFKIKNSKGEEVTEVPDLKFTFTAGGKERTDVPVDKVVKWAQQGIYNEGLQQEVTQARAEKPQLVAQIQERERAIQMLATSWERVLKGDLQYLESEMVQYQRAQSPEARAERAEREAREARAQSDEVRTVQAVQPVLQDIGQKFDQLEKQYPDVNADEILGRFQTLTAPLLVQGRIPPARLTEVIRLIENELTPWVESRSQTTTEAKKKADDTEKARQVAEARAAEQTRRAAQAKRQVARTVMPARQGHTSGTPSATTTTQTQKKTYKSADDVRADIRNVVRDFARETAGSA